MVQLGFIGSVREQKRFVKGKKAGKVTITATVGKKKYNCKITVKAVISADQTEITLEENKSTYVTITYRLDGTISWSSSDENVATCKWEDGWHKNKTKLYIYGNNPGESVITVKDKKTKDFVQIHVVVTPDTKWNYDRVVTMLKKINDTMESLNKGMDYATKALKYSSSSYRTYAVQYFIESAGKIKECREYAAALDPVIATSGKNLVGLLDEAFAVYEAFDSSNTTIIKLSTAVSQMATKFMVAADLFVSFSKQFAT